MKKYRAIKIISIVIGVIIAFFVIVNAIPPKAAVEDNPFIATEGTMLCAHRGGATQNPENTMKAYKSAVNEYHADILETDLWMTKDNHLVLNHDGKLNRTTDIALFEGVNYDENKEYRIEDYTLEELKKFNFGYQFEINGKRPYQNLVSIDDVDRNQIIHDNDLGITEFKDFLEFFYQNHKDLLFIIEIKNPGEKGKEAADIIADLLINKYPEYQNRVVIGTFNDEIESYLKDNYPVLLRGASPAVATKFIVTQLLHVNIFDNSTIACLQLPMKQSGLNLTWKTYINRAHRRNIAVQYWTINDADDMRKLIGNGADAIMSDDIALLRSVLNEYKK
ncbi:MAG: glycerophosphodiester phosphodiesterase family protein [Anaeroplasma sp.]